MSDSINIWPSEDELKNINDKVDLAPFGVISLYSDLLYNSYNKKLIGIITTRSKVNSNGDKTDFVYSLVLAQVKKDGAQIKIFEVEIQDDGWYPASIFLTKPYRELVGIAENEAQLRTFLGNSIKTDFVKEQIKLLIKE